MPAIDEYVEQPSEQRMERLARTADELAAAIEGRSDPALSRRPDGHSWSAKEVVCHLRDTEAVFAARVEQILAMTAEPFFADSDADRMAEERQYLCNDTGGALAAFRRRRTETLRAFAALTPAQWQKAGTHPARGRITIDEILSIMAGHDDDHLDQLARALDGRA